MGINAQTSVPKFTAGDTLTAANTNLLANGIPVFAGTATRDAAFGGTDEKTLAEGQFAFLEDTDIVQFYDGAVWKTLGGVVQTVSTQTGAVATTSTTMVSNNNIPQITEGAEFMTRTITPTDAANILSITVVFFGALSATDNKTFGLFVDSTANALAAVSSISPADYLSTTTFVHNMVAGTTSEMTFRVRAGGTSGTLTFNGRVGARTLGGVGASSITITEYKP